MEELPRHNVEEGAVASWVQNIWNTNSRPKSFKEKHQMHSQLELWQPVQQSRLQ